MKKIFLDFETRSRSDIKKAGAFKYASCLTTEILCACWKVQGEQEAHWSPFLINLDHIKDIFELIESDDYIIEAHNAHFEWAIWNYCGVKKYGFPKIPFSKFSCTAARAANLSLPAKLETVAEVLGLPVKKDTVGARTMMKMCKPKKDGTWHESEEDFERLIEYCYQDVRVTEKLNEVLPELSMKERDIHQLDFKINRRGVFLDVDKISKAAKFAEKYGEVLNGELAELTNFQVTKASQTLKLTQFLQDTGLPLAAVDKESISECIKYTNSPTLKRILQIRQSLSLSSTKKLYSMLAMGMRDHRARGTLVYFGANRTGRWSGKGIQIQNLPRGNYNQEQVKQALDLIGEGDYDSFASVFPDVLGIISSCIRSFIFYPNGGLYGGDFASIEPRVLFWLAGHEEGLAMYRNGIDPYKDMAAFIYNTTYEAVKKDQRQLGKACILGNGYAMGHKKFRESCAKAPYNIALTEDQAKEAVNAYRTKHAPVKEFWYDIENAAKNAIKNPMSINRVGKVVISRRGNFLFIKLPSGRKLAYFKPHIVVVEKEWGRVEQIAYYGVDQGTKKWDIVTTYGGKLVENITQAVARDLMSEAMINLDERGYNVTMLVHDEIVSEIDVGNKIGRASCRERV